MSRTVCCRYYSLGNIRIRNKSYQIGIGVYHQGVCHRYRAYLSRRQVTLLLGHWSLDHWSWETLLNNFSMCKFIQEYFAYLPLTLLTFSWVKPVFQYMNGTTIINYPLYQIHSSDHVISNQIGFDNKKMNLMPEEDSGIWLLWCCDNDQKNIKTDSIE